MLDHLVRGSHVDGPVWDVEALVEVTGGDLDPERARVRRQLLLDLDTEYPSGAHALGEALRQLAVGTPTVEQHSPVFHGQRLEDAEAAFLDAAGGVARQALCGVTFAHVPAAREGGDRGQLRGTGRLSLRRRCPRRPRSGGGTRPG